MLCLVVFVLFVCCLAIDCLWLFSCFVVVTCGNLVLVALVCWAYCDVLLDGLFGCALRLVW